MTTIPADRLCPICKASMLANETEAFDQALECPGCGLAPDA